MPDFSHLRRLPLSSFVKAIERREKLSDEFFDHLLDRIEPPLFDTQRMRALRAELCWFAPRAHRGRPPKGCSRSELATAVLSADGKDVPAVMLEAIGRRLREPPARDRLQRPRRALMERQKENKLSLMRGLYANLIGIALHGSEAWHPLLAEKAKLLRGSKRPRRDALKLTRDIMRAPLGLNPPSLGRMRNIL